MLAKAHRLESIPRLHVRLKRIRISIGHRSRHANRQRPAGIYDVSESAPKRHTVFGGAGEGGAITFPISASATRRASGLQCRYEFCYGGPSGRTDSNGPNDTAQVSYDRAGRGTVFAPAVHPEVH